MMGIEWSPAREDRGERITVHRWESKLVYRWIDINVYRKSTDRVTTTR